MIFFFLGFFCHFLLQNLAEELSASFFSGIRNEARMSRVCAELERVSRNFFQVASRYAQVIISEMHLPLESRSVRPLKMGGVLGGHKYIVRGILFKFANGDIFSDYPDPLYVANKVQGHELKGLRAYFGWFFNRGLVGTAGCSFPLAALIDYKVRCFVFSVSFSQRLRKGPSYYCIGSSACERKLFAHLRK